MRLRDSTPCRHSNSTGAAHRKGDKYEKALARLELLQGLPNKLRFRRLLELATFELDFCQWVAVGALFRRQVGIGRIGARKQSAQRHLRHRGALDRRPISALQ